MPVIMYESQRYSKAGNQGRLHFVNNSIAYGEKFYGNIVLSVSKTAVCCLCLTVRLSFSSGCQYGEFRTEEK